MISVNPDIMCFITDFAVTKTKLIIVEVTTYRCVQPVRYTKLYHFCVGMVAHWPMHGLPVFVCMLLTINPFIRVFAA